MPFLKCQAKLTPKGIIHDFAGRITGYDAAADHELTLDVLVRMNEACKLLRVNNASIKARSSSALCCSCMVFVAFLWKMVTFQIHLY